MMDLRGTGNGSVTFCKRKFHGFRIGRNGSDPIGNNMEAMLAHWVRDGVALGFKRRCQ